MHSLAAAILGYLLGSIPFGLILTRMAGMGDVRNIGSGSTGATNVLRTGHKGLAAATVLLDLAKGYVAVLLAGIWWPEVSGLAALMAVIGHCFPIWIGFKGGKGAATAAGACFGLGWPVGLVYGVIWLSMFGLTRISSLGSLSAAVAAPIAVFALGYDAALPYFIAIAAVVIWLHRSNIVRLVNGTEPKVGGSKSA